MNANVPKKQNAVIFGGTGKLFLQTIPVPNIKDNEVLLKVEACGVCGTDLNIYDVKGFSYGIPGQVLGHEIVGTIVKTGANVKMFKIGNRVCVDPNVFCGKCHYCHNNQTEQCDNMNCIGIHINGGYEQYVAIPDTQLYLLPKNIQWSEASILQPLSCCLHALENVNFKIGTNVCIVGGGTMGSMFVQILKYRGATNIVVLEPIARKRQMVKSLGATHTFDPYDRNFDRNIKKLGIKFQLVIEACGKEDGVRECIDLLSKKTWYLQFGTTPIKSLPIDVLGTLVSKEITISSSFLFSGTMQRAVELVNKRIIRLDKIIGHKFNLKEFINNIGDKKMREAGKFVVFPNKTL